MDPSPRDLHFSFNIVVYSSCLACYVAPTQHQCEPRHLERWVRCSYLTSPTHVHVQHIRCMPLLGCTCCPLSTPSGQFVPRVVLMRAHVLPVCGDLSGALAPMRVLSASRCAYLLSVCIVNPFNAVRPPTVTPTTVFLESIGHYTYTWAVRRTFFMEANTCLGREKRRPSEEEEETGGAVWVGGRGERRIFLSAVLAIPCLSWRSSSTHISLGSSF